MKGWGGLKKRRRTNGKKSQPRFKGLVKVLGGVVRVEQG